MANARMAEQLRLAASQVDQLDRAAAMAAATAALRDFDRHSEQIAAVVANAEEAVRNATAAISIDIWAELAAVKASLSAVEGAFGRLSSVVSQKLVPLEGYDLNQSVDAWTRRWLNDGLRAEKAFRRLTEPSGDGHRKSEFSARDRSIAESYYYRAMSQAQVGELVGLSQPGVGNRLRKIDQVIANEMLLQQLEEVATIEGWVTRRDDTITIADAVTLRLDIVASRPDGTRLAIEVKVNQLPSLPRLDDWTARMREHAPETLCAVAIYDLKALDSGLYVQADFKRLFQEFSDVPRLHAYTFDNVRRSLLHDLSLNAAVERAAA